MSYRYIQVYRSNGPITWECVEKIDYSVDISELVERIAHQYGVGRYRIDFCDSDGRLSNRMLSIAKLPPARAPVLPKIHVYVSQDHSLAFVRAYPKETSTKAVLDDLRGSFDLDDLYYAHSDEEIYNVARNIHQGILTKLTDRQRAQQL